MNECCMSSNMRHPKVTVSWMLFYVLIIISAKLFLDSQGASIYSWAILLMTPIPLYGILSFQRNRHQTEGENIQKVILENEEIDSDNRNPDDPLEVGFDVPIL